MIILTHREQQVWDKVVEAGRRMSDVAEELGVTPERVKQLRNAAMAKKYKP